MVEGAAPKMGRGIDRGNIRVFEEGLDSTYRKYLSDSERTRRNKESERLVTIARHIGANCRFLKIVRQLSGDCDLWYTAPFEDKSGIITKSILIL